MTEHQYQIQSEALKSQIRIEKVNQLQFDVQAERQVSEQSRIGVQIATQKTNEVQQDLTIARLKVEGKRKDAVILGHANTRKNQDANHANRENTLYGKTLDLKYQNLETGYDEAKKILDNRREMLKQQGLLA